MADQRVDEAHDIGRMARFRRLAEARERLVGGPPTPRNARAAVSPGLLAERRYRKAFYDLLFADAPFASPLVARPDEATAG